MYLVSRNIYVGKRRTSVRLEPETWDSLQDICKDEEITIKMIINLINDTKPESQSLTSAIRIFVMKYYKGKYTSSKQSVNNKVGA